MSSDFVRQASSETMFPLFKTLWFASLRIFSGRDLTCRNNKPSRFVFSHISGQPNGHTTMILSECIFYYLDRTILSNYNQRDQSFCCLACDFSLYLQFLQSYKGTLIGLIEDRLQKNFLQRIQSLTIQWSQISLSSSDILSELEIFPTFAHRF